MASAAARMAKGQALQLGQTTGGQSLLRFYLEVYRFDVFILKS